MAAVLIYKVSHHRTVVGRVGPAPQNWSPGACEKRAAGS